MPSFDPVEVHRFWHSYQDPTLYRVICFMEGVEDWTLDDDPQLEEAIQRLADTLDDIGNIDLQLEDDLINVCVSLKTGRYLRVLMCLDMAYAGSAAKVLMRAEEISESEEDMPGLFLRRNVVFERLRLISRVFSVERFKLITKALEEG